MNCCYTFLKVATFIYKLYTDMTLFKYKVMLHVFKGSNFYLQINHWYDFIQAWTDVTHFFKVSLENFPQSEHLCGFINMETMKFFQECFSTTLNLYHKLGLTSGSGCPGIFKCPDSGISVFFLPGLWTFNTFKIQEKP